MQCSSLLEARKCAWQFCSTSRSSHAVPHQPALWAQLRVPRPQQSTVSQSRPSSCGWRNRLRCHAQAPETKERETERSDLSNGTSNGSNGASQNGSYSNGSSNGNGFSKGVEASSEQQSLGSYNKFKDNKPNENKGTLDHMLEGSRQARSCRQRRDACPPHMPTL